MFRWLTSPTTRSTNSTRNIFIYGLMTDKSNDYEYMNYGWWFKRFGWVYKWLNEFMHKWTHAWIKEVILFVSDLLHANIKFIHEWWMDEWVACWMDWCMVNWGGEGRVEPVTFGCGCFCEYFLKIRFKDTFSINQSDFFFFTFGVLGIKIG